MAAPAAVTSTHEDRLGMAWPHDDDASARGCQIEMARQRAVEGHAGKIGDVLPAADHDGG